MNVFILCIYESQHVILTASRAKSKISLSYPYWINVVTSKGDGTTKLLAAITHGDSHIYVRPYPDLNPCLSYLLSVSDTKYSDTVCNCFIIIYLCLNVLYESYIPTYSSSSSSCTSWYTIFAVYVQTCLVQLPLALIMFSYTPDGGWLYRYLPSQGGNV